MNNKGDKMPKGNFIPLSELFKKKESAVAVAGKLEEKREGHESVGLKEYLEDKPKFAENQPVIVTEKTKDSSQIDANAPYQFVTGPAGSGKTFLINQRNLADPSYIELGATTGIAAINLSTKTIHSIIKYFDTRSLEEHFRSGYLQHRLREIRANKKALGIEEVSMMPARQLDIFFDAIHEINMDENPRKLGLHLIGDLCLAVGTKVMMANGSLQNIENIKVGDKVMGVDSSPRKVIRTTTGEDQMYLVRQTNGDNYVVNPKHLISLKRSEDGRRAESNDLGSSWYRYPNEPNYNNISAEEFITKSRKFRECFVGYKAGIINFNFQLLPIDPYFLGTWLGDGNSDRLAITNQDNEILQYWISMANNHGLGTTTQTYPNSRAVMLLLQNKHKPTNLWKQFRELKLKNNKHIPDIFMYNSENNRLQLLAGLLDTDGCWSGNRYTITLTSKILIHQVKQLADQLGFRTGFFLREGFYKDGRYNNTAWTVTIGGDTWRIPCKVEYKKSSIRNLKRSRLTSVLTVIPIGIGKYAGIEIDGDNLFLLADGTVTHNCQLPPVKKEPENAEICVKANCWSFFQENTIKLTKIWRQDNPDFISAINMVRSGNGKEAVPLLKKCGVQFVPQLIEPFDGTTIIPINAGVDDYNSRRLGELQSEMIRVTPDRAGEQLGEWKTFVPNELRLKIGAYVMILANDCPNFTYVNGDCGTIVGYNKTKNSFDIKLKRNDEVVSIGKIQRKNLIDDPNPSSYHFTPTFKPTVDQMTSKWSVGHIFYHPLRLAYASTVHKTQGLSLDKVQIDPSHWFFGQPGMAYVAISRAKTPEGLIIAGNEWNLIRKINTDPKVREYV